MTTAPSILKEIKTQPVSHLTQQDLLNLGERLGNQPTVVSLVLPMESSGAETRKNPIEFKNALQEAERELEKGGADDERLAKRLHRLKELSENESLEFWQHQEEGLAMYFNGEEEILCFLLKHRPAREVRVSRRPFLTSLRRYVDPNNYYVLSIDLNKLRLFEATENRVDEIELEHVPTSLEEAMKYDDPEKSLQFRTVSSSNLPGAGGGDAAYHGHGVTTEANEKRKIDRFFEMVSHNLADHFPDRNVPLILLGPPSELSRYREVNHYENLCDAVIEVNPSSLDETKLREKIVEQLGKLESDRIARELSRLEDHIGSGNGTVDIAEVTEAAMSGRVDRLFVREGDHLYGTVDPDMLQVEIHEDAKAGDTELISFAADRAALSGADVFVLDRDTKLPSEAAMAAVLRY